MEEKINLLYNFLYNDSFNDCFNIDKITLGKININDIKIVNEIEALENLKEIVNSKLSFLNFNNEDNIILLKRFSDTFPVTVKIGTYTDDTNNLSSLSNNDALFSYLLSSLVINKHTSHILLPIVNFDIKYEKIEPLLKNLPIYKSINDKVEFNEIKNIFSVRIREHFFQSKNLKEYLKENKCDFRQLIFQVIHTLAVIQKEFPGFRHNNLSVENIIIYLKKKDVSENTYIFGNYKWVIPDIGFDIKITNFEKATLPKYYGIKNQRDTNVPFINELNPYFDLHTFMSSLVDNFLSDCDLETKKFIDKIIPSKLRGMYYLNKNEILFKPSDLLKDSYFNKYKQNNDDNNKNNEKDNNKEEENNNKEENDNNKEEIKLLESNTYLNKKKLGKITLDTENYNMLFKSKPRQTGAGENKEFEMPLDVDKPESFKTNDEKKVENINNPPKPEDKKPYNPDKKPYNPDKKPYNPDKKPYNPDKKPYNPDGPKPWEPGHPKYDPNYKPSGPKPWEPGHPKYDPNYKPRDKPNYKPEDKKNYKTEDESESNDKKFTPKKEENVRKIKEYEDENINRVQHKPRNFEYKPEKTPWSEPIKETPKPPFKPREEPPKINYPSENFNETKKYDSFPKSNFEQPDIPPGIIPLYDPNGMIMSQMMPYGRVAAQPINKIYNISLSDPLGNHSVINQIYEDVLPSDKTVYTFITLKEREVIKKFLRNSILDKYDGEEFSIQGGKQSLLSWIKIYDINPYSRTTNPYQDLPYGFLLYRSAYPIKYNKENGGIQATPTSIGINIRIYQMSEGASFLNLMNKPTECEYFDVWRDIIYYREVDKIIKEKVSPNFINMLLYVFDNESDAGFDKVNMIKETTERNTQNLQKINNDKVNEIQLLKDATKDLPAKPITNRDDANHDFIKKYIPMKNNLPNYNPLTPNLNITKLTNPSKKVLIALTESPNNNIIRWNSKIYQDYGTIRKMTATGYHNPNVWRSILFQLVHACGILENRGIYINNFNLQNNIYIKDVPTDNTGNSCWIYKVDNIEYFVPNYGYLLTVDSKYADIEDVSNELQFKIYGTIYKQNMSKNNFGELVKEALKIMMNKDKFTINNANDIDNEVDILITKIRSELNISSNILSVLPKCFGELFNNKIGKTITQLEKQNFNIFSKPNYVEGSLMIRQKRFDDYEWVIYRGIGDKNKRKIIYKDENGNFIPTDVFSSSLFSYPEQIRPEEITIIETYIS